MAAADLPDVTTHDGRPVLVGTHCADCDEQTFPARERCPVCRSRDVADAPFGREATVESYTQVHTPWKGFEPPYLVSFVRLSPGDVRTFAPVFDAALDDLSVGAVVEVSVRETTTGDPIWGVTLPGGKP